MSEKKFALQTVGDTVVRNNQTNEIYWNHNLVHLINSLSKENEQLKSVVKQLYFKTDDKFLNADFISEIERLCNE